MCLCLLSAQSIGWLVEDGDLFNDFYVETLERRDVRGSVREQSDFADAEVGEDLTAEPDLAEDALVVAVFFAGAGFTFF